MKEYLLFIDTEGSDLPKKWDLPYAAKDNWPYSIQVSWIIYNKNGKWIKQENHFIKEDDFTIAPSAVKVHGITREFLDDNGESREAVLTLLETDLALYQPLVIGHFMELDARMMGADFYRLGKKSPLEHLPAFCTMRASAHLVQNPTLKYLRLFDLYQTLFKKTLQNQHNALTDAKATAECFFELERRGEIDENTIQKQVTFYTEPALKPVTGCSFVVAAFILLIILTAF